MTESEHGEIDPEIEEKKLEDEPEVASDAAAESCANSDGEAVKPEKAKTPEEEAAEWREIALRRQADLENFRKRMERERMDSIRYANGSLLEELLPVIDNFEMGLEAARQESEDSMIFKGMGMVKKQLADFLEGRGVKEVETGGGVFDPTVHDAVGQEESEVVADGHIIRTMRRGYYLHDRLLRAASVIVATSPKGDAGDKREAPKGEES